MIALRLALFAGRPAAAEVTKQPDFSEQNCCPHNQVHKSKLLARTDPITRWRRPDPTGRSSSSGRRSYRGPGRPACRRRQCSRPTTIWSSFTSRRAGEFFFVVCKRECGGNDGVHDWMIAGAFQSPNAQKRPFVSMDISTPNLMSIDALRLLLFMINSNVKKRCPPCRTCECPRRMTPRRLVSSRPGLNNCSLQSLRS